MKVVLCYDFGESAVEEIPRPDPNQTEVLVEVRQVQLSVTECSLYRGGEITYYETITSRLGPDGAKLFEHEFCGQVVETGEEVIRYTTGDRVYAPGRFPASIVPPARPDTLTCATTRETTSGTSIPDHWRSTLRCPPTR